MKIGRTAPSRSRAHIHHKDMRARRPAAAAPGRRIARDYAMRDGSPSHVASPLRDETSDAQTGRDAPVIESDPSGTRNVKVNVNETTTES